MAVGDCVRLINPEKLYMCMQKHNEDGRTTLGMRGHGSVPLSHSGNVATRIGLQQQQQMVKKITRNYISGLTIVQMCEQQRLWLDCAVRLELRWGVNGAEQDLIGKTAARPYTGMDRKQEVIMKE